MELITIDVECTGCDGHGTYEVDAGRYTSHSVNQSFIEVACSECFGACTVEQDVCADCHAVPDDCMCPEETVFALVTVCQALVPIQYCMECRHPTTGSIGQAGFFWISLCQICKDRSDGILRAQVITQAIIVRTIDAIVNRHLS